MLVGGFLQGSSRLPQGPSQGELGPCWIQFYILAVIKEAQQGLKMIIFKIAPTGNQIRLLEPLAALPWNPKTCRFKR